MALIKFLIKCLVWIFLHILYIFPVDKRRMYFSSFVGRQFSCNPKYLYNFLIASGITGYSYIWEFSDIKKASLVPDAKVVRSRCLKSVFLCMTSKYIICNTEFPWYIPLRACQILVQTWHGGGAYKKVGVDAGWNKIANLEQRLNSRQISFYVSSCRKFTEIMAVSKCVPPEKFLQCGMPRNSFLLSMDEARKRKILEKMNLRSSSKIVLYAPTYRGRPSFRRRETSAIPLLDIKVLRENLGAKFGGEWLIAFRGHYYDANNEDVSQSDCIDMTAYDDMQELLYVSDVLITDFSSSMWDFSLTGRPVFLFAPDIDSYDVERGFYTNPYSWPFPISKTGHELTEAIMNFNAAEYSEKVREHHNSLVSYECEDSARKIFDAMGVMTE
ncbi:MAG: CDP-glycerol glycerophosphotransferase family protein [Treponema sp.]|nr:CDP-glycerol glycerophosphotransferase family protein [Treponema sp.]